MDEHLILIGFMACGKSTVGRLCARALDVPLVDTDALIERRAGMTIPEIFARQGEAAFREMEHDLALSLARRRPSVIATGGGMATFARNVPLLRGAGRVVLIDRGFSDIWRVLSRRGGRPLAAQRSREALYALYRARRPLYLKAAHFVVRSDGAPQDCARKVLALLPHEGEA